MIEGTTTRTVSFACDGYQLVGTLHLPPAGAPRCDTAVVVLNQGPLDRTGAHRISLQLARRWSALGMPVLRFDARGVGESEGDWADPSEGAPIRTLYKNVEEGGWIADSHAAIDFVLKETKTRQVVLAGLCGGGATAVHASAHPAVRSVLSVGMPIRLNSEVRGAADLVDQKLQTETQTYVKKLFRWEAWKRILTMQSDYQVLWAVFSTRLKRLFRRGPGLDSRLNAPLMRSFEAASKKQRRVLFVYPEKDYLWVEFQELFLPRFPQQKFKFELATIPDANHTFTERSWQDALFTIVDKWTAAQANVEAVA